MALALVVLLMALLGTTVRLLYGKMVLKGFLIPSLLMLLAGDFILLYAKYVSGNSFLTVLLYFPGGVILLAASIFLIIILIKMIARMESGKKILAISFSLVMTIVIISVPSLTQIDKFNIYQKDYYAVSDSLFQAYDNGQIAVGSSLQTNSGSKRETAELEKIFSDKVIHIMKRLKRSAGVESLEFADKDVIYFSFGAGFQSIDGIAILRDGTSLSADNRARKYYQNVQFEYIADDVYYFYGGL